MPFANAVAPYKLGKSEDTFRSDERESSRLPHTSAISAKEAWRDRYNKVAKADRASLSKLD
jgi:hypothetical protein